MQWANLLSLNYEYMHLLVTTQIRRTIEFTGIEIMPLRTAFAVALKILRAYAALPVGLGHPVAAEAQALKEQILVYMAQGLSQAETARRLEVSRKTVS